MRAAGQPDTTIGLRTYHVRRVMADLDADPWLVDVEDLVEYLASKPWAPNTRRSYRGSLRAFYTWGQGIGRRLDNPGLLIPVVKVPRGRPRPTPEAILREALAGTTQRIRLMMLLAAWCGLRRSEIARLRREDVEADLMGWSLRVVGKGGHVRVVPMPHELAALVRGGDPGWLFPSSRRPGPLTPGHVGKLVSDAMPTGWTCHTLRHRCATVAYERGRNIRAVQELLGHASSRTTDLYTQVADSEIRRAVEAAAA